MTTPGPRRRLSPRIAAAALAAFSLAGCSEGDPNSEADPTRDVVRTPGANTGDGDGVRGTGAVGDAPGEPRTGTAGAGCDEAQLRALEDERGALEARLSEIEYELRPYLTGVRATDYLLDQLDPGFGTHTLERGREVGLAARPSVVVLEILDGGSQTGHATAWFVDEDHLFTNAHNVYPRGPDTAFRGVTPDGDRFDVEVVDLFEGMYPDVALLRTEYRGTPLPVTSPDELAAGQPLVQVGNPEEIGFWIISMGRFVEGRPSESLDGDGFTALRSVVPGRPGVSGSPVLTLEGEVVGMTNGGEPVTPFRDLGTPPPVAPDIVFDGPIGDVTLALHDGSDILQQKLEDWR